MHYKVLFFAVTTVVCVMFALMQANHAEAAPRPTPDMFHYDYERCENAGVDSICEICCARETGWMKADVITARKKSCVCLIANKSRFRTLGAGHSDDGGDGGA